MEFVPLDLVGQKEVGKIIDIGNRGNKTGKSVFFRRIVHGTAAMKGGNLGPMVNLSKAGSGKDFGSGSGDDQFGVVDGMGKTKKSVGKSGNVDFFRIVSQGMENGIEFNMGIGEGV